MTRALRYTSRPVRGNPPLFALARQPGEYTPGKNAAKLWNVLGQICGIVGRQCGSGSTRPPTVARAADSGAAGEPLSPFSRSAMQAVGLKASIGAQSPPTPPSGV